MSLELAALDLILRFREKRYLARATDFPRARARMEREAARLGPWPTALRETTLAGRPALRRDPPPGGPVLMWLHGGAYCLGSPRTHARMACALADRLQAGVVLPDYRLAPEHPFPAAHDDACAAWEALAAEIDPGRIAVGGDSAGGGLAFALLQGLIAAGRPRPAAVLAFSPWVDLSGTAASLTTLARRDALLPAARFAEIRALYLAGADPRDPRASPRFGRFPGAPPILIQSSRAEILRDDARALAARLRDDAVPVTHDEWRLTPHVWQIYAGLLPEADQALDAAAAFLRPLLDASPAKGVAGPRSQA